MDTGEAEQVLASLQAVCVRLERVLGDVFAVAFALLVYSETFEAKLSHCWNGSSILKSQALLAEKEQLHQQLLSEQAGSIDESCCWCVCVCQGQKWDVEILS